MGPNYQAPGSYSFLWGGRRISTYSRHSHPLLSLPHHRIPPGSSPPAHKHALEFLILMLSPPHPPISCPNALSPEQNPLLLKTCPHTTHAASPAIHSWTRRPVLSPRLHRNVLVKVTNNPRASSDNERFCPLTSLSPAIHALFASPPSLLEPSLAHPILVFLPCSGHSSALSARSLSPLPPQSHPHPESNGSQVRN